jgi:hypothetical protein
MFVAVRSWRRVKGHRIAWVLCGITALVIGGGSLVHLAFCLSGTPLRNEVLYHKERVLGPTDGKRIDAQTSAQEFIVPSSLLAVALTLGTLVATFARFDAEERGRTPPRILTAGMITIALAWLAAWIALAWAACFT